MLKFKILFLILFCSSLVFAQVKFQKHTIAISRYYSSEGISKIVDLDNDNDMDILGFSNANELIFWLENNGKQNYTKHVISSNVPPSSYIGGRVQSHYIFPIDLEKDGDIDILYSVFNNYESSGFIGWFENDGKQNFTLHEFMKFDCANSIIGIDFDFDGDIDIIASSLKSGLIWLENDGNLNFVLHNVYYNYVVSFFPFDMDKDNDYDLFVTRPTKRGGNSDVLEYFEDQGNFNYKRQVIDSKASATAIIDFDNDNDLDIIGVENFIRWWRNDGMQNFEKLTLLERQGYNLKMADFDMDGDFDFITYEYYLERDTANSYIEFDLKSLGVDLGYIKVADLDNDSDPDLIAHSVEEFLWYENLGKPRPISFPDSNLAKAVRYALGDTLEIICDTHLKHLIQLKAENQLIHDLTGLEFAKNLKSLNLKSNAISNLQPLQGLLHLDTLILAGNNLTDSCLIDLYSLDSLVYLDLQNNPQIKSGTAMEKLGQELLLIDCEDILWDGICGVDPNSAPFIQHFTLQPESIFVNQEITLEITAGDSEFHLVQFFIDWGEDSSLDSSIAVLIDSIHVFKHFYAKAGTFEIKCQLRDEKGALSPWATLKTVEVNDQISSVNHSLSEVNHFQLYPNYPNPFNLQTLIKFQLDNDSEHSLSIYNMKGELVRCISQGIKPAGIYDCTWDGKDANGRAVSSGIYWCHLKHQERQAKIKLMLIK